MRDRSEVDHLTHMVHCHVCPGRYTAEEAGLPGNTDQHPRYVSRMIGSAHYGGLWHCPEHAHPTVTTADSHHGYPRAECGCPVGDRTDAPATAEQIARWEAQQAERNPS